MPPAACAGVVNKRPQAAPSSYEREPFGHVILSSSVRGEQPHTSWRGREMDAAESHDESPPTQTELLPKKVVIWLCGNTLDLERTTKVNLCALQVVLCGDCRQHRKVIPQTNTPNVT